MANFTALNLSLSNPVLAAAAGRERDTTRNLLVMRDNSCMIVRDQPAAGPGRRRSVKVKAMMGKYKGTQMREQQLTEMIEEKVKEAKEVCGEDEKSDECKVAWDEVEEVSQAKADLRLKLEIMHQDPLESFCQDNPETDECRLYED